MRILLAAVLGAVSLLAETNVLKNFTLIDGTGGQPLPNAAMVVSNGRIKWTGPVAELRQLSNAQIIDLSGKYVMPGIINLHGHVGSVVDLTQDPKNFTRENLEKNLRTYASYGVTTIVSMGGDLDPVFQLRSEQRSGRPAMARIYTAGRGFTGKSGYPTSAAGMKGVPYEVESAGQVGTAISELALKKVDLVKIWVDDHLGKERKIPLELSKAIIENAHKHKLPVAAHIFYLADARQLVDAGLDALVHSVRDQPVDQALIDSMKKRGAWQAAATLTRELSVFVYAEPPEWLRDPFMTRSVSPKVIETVGSEAYRKRIAADPDFAKYPVFLETAKKNLKRLADAGVKYGFGTDSGPPARFQGFFEHLEMELMVESGLTPMQVITAATRNSAEFLKAKDLGTLEAGKWADLIVLGKNPIENIKNTRTLEAVYVGGNQIK